LLLFSTPVLAINAPFQNEPISGKARKALTCHASCIRTESRQSRPLTRKWFIAVAQLSAGAERKVFGKLPPVAAA